MMLTQRDVRRLNKFWKPFGLKFCNGCGNTKDIEQFYEHQCKGCRAQYIAKRYAENLDTERAKSRAQTAAYRAANPEYADYGAKYYSGGRGADKPWPDGHVGYDAAHARVYAQRGRASGRTCPCGKPATEWAYDHQDPGAYSGPVKDRKGNEKVMHWSGNPHHYIPMCHPCHVSLDKKMSKQTEVSA